MIIPTNVLSMYLMINIYNFIAMHRILAPEPTVPLVCIPAIDDLLSNQDFLLAAAHPMTCDRN